MPELPEVEVIRRRLDETVLDRTIASIRVTESNYTFLTSSRELRKHLVGQHFTRINRRGKYLLFELEGQGCLVIHLGMTGQLFSSRALSPRLVQRSARTKRQPSDRFEPDKHTHLTIVFAGPGDHLYFRDSRKFGKIFWLGAKECSPRLDRLGPDAAGITALQLTEALAGRRAAIKPLLLDQSILAGVGNIYADESLHSAAIAPTRPGHELDPREIRALARAIRHVLKRAIALGGSSIDDYLHPDGSDGSFQKRFAVYGREGQSCRRCSGHIQRIVMAQRSAHYCPSCQR